MRLGACASNYNGSRDSREVILLLFIYYYFIAAAVYYIITTVVDQSFISSVGDIITMV